MRSVKHIENQFDWMYMQCKGYDLSCILDCILDKYDVVVHDIVVYQSSGPLHVNVVSDTGP